jgi:RNA polymerase sigma factor (sigma-70 family)
MDQDTDLGGTNGAFPSTQCAVLVATRSTDPLVRQQAFEVLVAAYWKPVYKYIRLQAALSNEDAKDLTQAFFAAALEKRFFERYDPAKAKFRTYLRVCVDGFVANERKAKNRLKRGGTREILSLDFVAAEGELRHQDLPGGTDLDDYFHQEWVRSLFGLAVDELRRSCAASDKHVQFALFQRYDLEGPDLAEKPTYAQLAEEFGLSAMQVTNYLAFARRQFRQLILDQLRATTGSDEEFQAEVQRLLGGQRR